MLLEVRNLKTHYALDDQIVRAVDGVSFCLEKGDNLGLVGESGCGKTTTAKSINQILPGNAAIVEGDIVFRGQNLVGMSESELNKVRWQNIAMVTQSAMNSLDPVFRIGNQIVEAIQIHTRTPRQQAWKRAEELFAMVGLEKKRLKDYPHQLSGGMKQRVVIAMALALQPDLIIADEPTTALDVVVQDGILDQFVKLQREIQSSMILVTHDISVVAEICQRVVVMYAGKIMEQGTTQEIFKQPYHPYTLGLLNAYPTLASATGELISIAGSPPDLSQDLLGCRFQPRCPFADGRCSQEPPTHQVNTGHTVLCHYPERFQDFRSKAQDPKTWKTAGRPAGTPPVPGAEVLTVQNLTKRFPVKTSLVDAFRGRKKELRALDGVSFSVREKEILGFAGESGSGKSTLGEVIAQLQHPSEGNILYLGKEQNNRSAKLLKQFRRHYQVVFQDPYETLNPRFTVLNTILEPLKIHGIGATYDQKVELVKQALQRAELTPPEQYLHRFPHQLSGGQRQRISLARAIVIEPKFIIADEPVSMLDVSVRAGILNLLQRLRDEMGLSLLYISHDLATIRYICDRTAILYLGRIMEIGETETVIQNACHPYTKMLLAAVPIPDPDGHRQRVDPRGEIPDPIDLPNGCRFHPRCSSALAHCGWEGKDLQRLLNSLQNHTGRDKEQMAQIEKTTIVGIDLLIKAKSASSLQDLAKFLNKIMDQHNPTMSAAASIEKNQNTLVVRFSPQPEPELQPTATGQLTACYLCQHTPGHQ